ncbi:MAG: aldo/keto reductase, partial [Gammaproteobacteria bacterium]
MKTFSVANGSTMPALGLGTWKSDPGIVSSVVREAIGIGYRHFDCAPIYGNEAEIGQAINAAIRAGDVRREELWITSKLWNSDHARADVGPAIERTLRDLNLEYLDLYLIHWPVAFRPGISFPQEPAEYLSASQAPISQTWAGMEQIASRGLCRTIG